jgi:uncharacterized protein
VLDLPDPGALPFAMLIAGGGGILVSAALHGLTGFGFALAAVPLLSLVMPPMKAVPLVLCLLVLAGLLDLASARVCHKPSLRWLILGALLGSPIGVVGLSLIAAPVAQVAIAALTAAAALILARGFALPSMPGTGATVLVGLVAGVFAGLAAMPGPPIVTYYMSAPLKRTVVHASLIIFFFANAVIAAVSAVWFGLVSIDAVILAVLALPVMLLGVLIGKRFTALGSDATHRRIAVGALGAIALATAAKGLSALVEVQPVP